jgi:uncharacterized protein
MCLNKKTPCKQQDIKKATLLATKPTGVIDKKLLEILVCPIDKGELIELKKSSQLECKTCKTKYTVKDGIPIMLIP